MDLIQILGFVFFGLVVGGYGTLIGAGGGFIIVPVLLLFFNWPHQEAVGTSLLVVTANAASGTVSYWRQKRIDLQTGWRFALATLPGAVLGSFVVDLLSGQLFNIVFGVALVSVSVYLILNPERKRPTAGESKPTGWRSWGYTTRHIVDSNGSTFDYGFSMPWGLVLSFFVGFMSSILGIGGGIIHVPALITLFDFPAHIATATSHFILMISAATGTVSHLSLGHVRIAQGIAMAVGAIIGAQIGGALSHRVKGVWIVRGLAAALTLVGIRLIFS